MNEERYQQLVRETCAALEVEIEPVFLPQPHQGMASGIEIGGIPVVFGYAPQAGNKEIMFIYCTYGALPEEKREKILLVLMEFNFLLFRPNAPMFIVEPTSQNVLFAHARPFSEIVPTELANDLQIIAQAALEWRKNYFIGGEDQNDVKGDLMANFA